ncbi:MAG TPA: FHA domain-containing protein [Tepidisphaeraceae bacterium]|nr:FHA domain-containing protein [Tepidisphaeraceae bacterium]
MFRSDGERRSFSITRDMTVVGRREDCDLRIPLGDVSRKHCRLVRDSDMLRLEDLGSSNGTYLNGQRVQESLLTPGDSIQVGPVVFVLQVDGIPADEDLHPVTAEMAEQPAAAAVPSGNLGPLSPTAQSEAGDALLGRDELDIEGLEPMPSGHLDDNLDLLEEPARARPAGDPLDLDLDLNPHQPHPHA